tara:strand:+ start:73265 stop:74215 length:951 start_codon:yes stop_codon:yes gene_type:complete
VKKLILFYILSTSICFSNDYTIKIPQDVIEAMDLSPELAARLSGGDIIGNGGGLVEQEFRFAYRRLPKIIEICEESQFCPFSGLERTRLIKIKEVASKFLNLKDRLIFLSESKYPGFFRDSNDSEIRIAKTAFIPGAPIFVNLDLLYIDNKPSIEFSTMIALLVHELGHQIGVKSHSELDEMGAKLRDYLTQDTRVNSYDVNGLMAQVRIFNLQKVDFNAEVFFSYNGTIIPLTSRIRSELTCKRKKSLAIGFEIANPHWERFRSDRGVFILGYNAWLRVRCLELNTSAIWTEDRDLLLNFHFYDNEYLSLDLKIK